MGVLAKTGIAEKTHRAVFPEKYQAESKSMATPEVSAERESAEKLSSTVMSKRGRSGTMRPRKMGLINDDTTETLGAKGL